MLQFGGLSHFWPYRMPPQNSQSLPSTPYSSIEMLVEAHTEKLLKGALGLGFSKDDARELVQVVWLTYLEVAHTFKGESKISTFLYGILYNKAKEKWREDRKLVPDEKIDELVESYFDSRGHWIKPLQNPEQFMATCQTLHLIEHCFDKLPLAQRTAFWLREINEEATSEVCHIMKVTNSNLGVLLFRAKTRLRECIQRRSAASD